jgi:hypothetical protein
VKYMVISKRVTSLPYPKDLQFPFSAFIGATEC